MITLSLRRTCLAGIACLVGSAASAAPYTTTILTYPGALETYPLAENNAGTVIGYWLDSNYGQHGFIYQDGTLSDFNPPNATGSIPSGINDKGDVVGYFTDSSQNTHGYLYKATTGKFKTVDLAGSGYTTLNLINRQGVAVGFGIDSGGYGEIFTYAHGVFTTAIDNQEQPAAYGVNHLGTIVGSVTPPNSREAAFTYSDGQVTLIPFTDAFYSIAFAINEKNQSVGQFVNNAGVQFGFIYAPGGSITEVQPSGATDSFFLAVNNKGEAAGATFDANYNSQAWVYHPNTGKSVTFGITGYTGVAAVGINDAGQLIGECVGANSYGYTFIAVPTK